MKPKRYARQINYYETDRMGIVHNSNYVRYMEEVRMEYMCGVGVDYRRVEECGVLMPVINVTCRYRRPFRFGEIMEMEAKLVYFNGIRAKYEYRFYPAGGDTPYAEGTSEHCFMDAQTRRPISIKDRLPKETEIMSRIVSGEDSSVTAVDFSAVPGRTAV